MKIKLALITAGFLFISLSSFAQIVNVNAIPVSDLNVQYIRVFEIAFQLGKKITAKIDYGQKFSGRKNQFIKDEDGEIFYFNSVAHIWNVMHINGYELREIVETEKGGVAFYILEKI